ncbi:MAG: hypothetical protein CM15mV135_100 [uncultured marine virus]|nr:MAG: hypothetical protein CM15mV135_100 [uncultured marine virus]
MAYDVLNDESYLATTEDGKPICMFGISDTGCIWLHMTNEVQKYPIAFIRQRNVSSTTWNVLSYLTALIYKIQI